MSELLDWAFRGNRSGRKVKLKGFNVKGGKVVKDEKRLNVSARIHQRSSKKVRVVPKGKT